jgi:hypothetical protein
VSWDSRFAEPIGLPSGVRLASLRNVIVHLVNTLPSSERGTPVILTAAELITSAAERDSPIEFARIATLRALNRHVERVLNPDIVKTRIGAAVSWSDYVIDIYGGADWTEMDIEDLKAAIESGRSIEEVAQFLCPRADSVADVARKSKELGLKLKTNPPA